MLLRSFYQRSISYTSRRYSKWLQHDKKLDLDAIEKNVLLRQHKNNIPKIRELLDQLEKELSQLPNDTHPRLVNYGTEPRVVKEYDGNKNYLHNDVIEFSTICKRLKNIRTDHLGNYTGHKSYYFMGDLALLEQAIIQYALAVLKMNNFQLMAVPDILDSSVIEGCGMQTEGDRTQVYKLDSKLCLSGTSEMALAGFFAQKTFKESELPIKVAAISRCYRAETSGLHEEKGVYRVHQFTKVEMFAICTPNQSESMLASFKDIEVELYQNLNLNFRLLDMPPFELGAPAYQKYDIEAWMAGRKMWGEISSCSNCTDYQAKRLNIKYSNADKGAENDDDDDHLNYCHTVNGTAAAIPRLLIALVETYQIGRDVIQVPEVLRKYLGGRDEIRKEQNVPELKLVKHIRPI